MCFDAQRQAKAYINLAVVKQAIPCPVPCCAEPQFCINANCLSVKHREGAGGGILPHASTAAAPAKAAQPQMRGATEISEGTTVPEHAQPGDASFGTNVSSQNHAFVEECVLHIGLPVSESMHGLLNISCFIALHQSEDHSGSCLFPYQGASDSSETC